MNRQITRDNDFIYITVQSDGSTYVTSYNDVLWDVLHLDSLCSFINSAGYLKLRCRVNGENVDYTLADIAYASYAGWLTNPDLYLKEMKRLRDYKRNYYLNTDHLDNNIYNNTKYNLSLMDSVLNKIHKKNITARFVSKHDVGCAYVDGKYRVVYSLAVEPDIIEKIIRDKFGKRIKILENCCLMQKFICHNENQLVGLLKSLETMSYEDVSPDETAKTVCDANETLMYKSATLSHALYKQNQIANMDESLFDLWDKEYIADNKIKMSDGYALVLYE